MNAVLGILALAVIVGVAYVMQHVSNAATRAFNRNILFRQSYTRSMQHIRNTTAVLTSLSPSDAIEAVRHGIGAQPTETLLRAGVVVKATTDVDLAIKIGNVAATNYICRAWATPHNDATVVRFEVVQWKELNGVPMRGKELVQLKDDFVAALRRADPGARLLGAGARSTPDGPPLGGLRVCMDGSCELADLPTQRLRCPECDQFTAIKAE